MKVDRSNMQGVTGAYRAQGARPVQTPNTAAPVAKSDAVNVSRKAQEATVLRAKVKQAPEVRMDLVNKIKAQVEAGTYSVAPEKVAEKLLKSKVLD
ncbi:MAG TPA: flagellar biosynthesis anti-sigma factor FlgM [Symbiobacteriaceae bacterium]|nr:flagellar biosynthesis anti-sigma factor FlgM [Symbiobacteriaceae bacterium]